MWLLFFFSLGKQKEIVKSEVSSVEASNNIRLENSLPLKNSSQPDNSLQSDVESSNTTVEEEHKQTILEVDNLAESSISGEENRATTANLADNHQSESKVQKKDEKAKTVILEGGKTLRILALELFGNKDFWVYLYLENVDLIPNPNRVNAGIELKIPDTDKYFINNKNPESISKAKSEGDRVLNIESKI